MHQDGYGLFCCVIWAFHFLSLFFLYFFLSFSFTLFLFLFWAFSFLSLYAVRNTFFPSYFTVLASGQEKKKERERKRSNAGSLDWLRAGRELRNERTESMSVMQTGNLVAV